MALPIIAVTQSASSAYQIIFDNENDEESEWDRALEEVVSGYRRVTPTRIKLFVELTIPMSTAKEFQNDFRISRRSFERLLLLIGPSLSARSNTGRKKIDAEKQLLAVLWLLATPECYRYGLMRTIS